MSPLILIVDDSIDTRILLRNLLNNVFIAQWIEADSGKAASSALLQKHQISLVISDLNMQNGTGLWLHQFMLKEKIQTPLILFTAEEFHLGGRPQSDQVLKAVVAKFKLNDLIHEIKQLGFASDRR